MSLQKYRAKSEITRQSNILPQINKKVNYTEENTISKLTLPDQYEKYIRAKLEKALQLNSQFKAKQKSYKNNSDLKRQIATTKQIVAQSQPSQKLLTQIRHAKSTPKIRLIGQSKTKKFRQNKDRYLHNEKISLQLKLPKKLNLSADSDDQSVHKALLKDQGFKPVEAAVFILKKNSQYNLIKDKTKDSRVYLTENVLGDSKLQIIQNNHSYPLMQNIPLRKQPLYSSPKQQKYIKQAFVGQQAINKFYNRYKNIDKIRQLQNFKLQLNPLTTILTILQNYNIPPKKMQVIKLKGEQAILDLKNCALGSGVSIKAVAEIIQKVKIFQQIDLSSNHITPDISDIIIPNLINMKRINISYNKIGRRGVQLFTEMFYNEQIDEDCELQQLNLQSNNISDTCFGNFFTNLLNMNFLLVLNLSKNCLGSYASTRLKDFFMNDNQLMEIYLHWCEMGPKATKMIFQGLIKNNCLRVLDISWNQIGLDGITSFCSFLKGNDTLVHLDVSFCEIDEIDTRKIAKTLKINHAIFGIHYQGNMGYIDFKGYLHPIKKQNRETPMSIRAGLIQRINSINIVKSYHYNSYGASKRNVCWICEGWQEKYFKINKGSSQKACFIHLDFQNYNGVMMSDKGTYFQLIRMCPPKAISLFYTKVLDSQLLVHTHNPIQTGQIKMEAFNKKIYDFTIQGKKIQSANLKVLNMIASPRYYNQIFNQDYITKIHCQPRSDDMRAQNLFVNKLSYGQAQKPVRQKKSKKKGKKEPQLIKEISLKSIPDQFDSIFNGKNKSIGQGQEYNIFIKKCVDFDIAHSKVTKIVKNQKQMKEVRNLLQKNYQIFQKIYYYLANNNPNIGGVYSIPEHRFQKFIQQQGYQSKRVTKAKIRLKLISCVANFNSDSEIQGFYRPQFFQFLLRLAMQKWCITIPKKEGETEQQKAKRQKYPLSISQAFGKMLKTLKKYEQKADCSKWRDENLTSYEISVVIKSYSFVLQQIYEKYSGTTQRNMNTKTKKKMLLEQFKVLCLNAEIRKTRQALKDLQIDYRSSKKLQVQDGISDTGLDYVEFLQTFCRFAEGLYLIPIGSESYSIWQKQIISIQQIPLFLKIQKLLKQIYNKNYDIKNKKYDMLFETGLFSEQVVMLMNYYKQKYQNKDQMRKTLLSTHARMNSLQSRRRQKITLKFLIDLLAIKALQIQQQNRQRMKDVQPQEKESEQSEDQNIV